MDSILDKYLTTEYTLPFSQVQFTALESFTGIDILKIRICKLRSGCKSISPMIKDIFEYVQLERGDTFNLENKLSSARNEGIAERIAYPDDYEIYDTVYNYEYGPLSIKGYQESTPTFLLWKGWYIHSIRDEMKYIKGSYRPSKSYIDNPDTQVYDIGYRQGDIVQSNEYSSFGVSNHGDSYLLFSPYDEGYTFSISDEGIIDEISLNKGNIFLEVKIKSENLYFCYLSTEEDKYKSPSECVYHSIDPCGNITEVSLDEYGL